MSFKKYINCVDSGVAWIGDIPDNWRVMRLKNAVKDEYKITYGIVQAGPNHDGGIPYIRPTDMTDEAGVKSIDDLLRTTPEIAASYSRSEISFGDIVCSIGPSFGKVMITPPELAGANLTQGTARISVKSSFVPRYIFWVLRSVPSRNQWEVSVGGATFRALNLEPLSETFFAFPAEKKEQQEIADFLDKETARIDELIEKQEKLLELLRERRSALISAAVTGKIDVRGLVDAKEVA